MKKSRGKLSNQEAVKIATKAQTSKSRMAPSAQAELTPDHAAFRQLLGQVADGLDSLQHHLNAFQQALTASGTRRSPDGQSFESLEGTRPRRAVG
jgi:hypothetical protein